MGFFEAIINLLTCAEGLSANDDLREYRIRDFPWKWFFGVIGATVLVMLIAYFLFRP